MQQVEDKHTSTIALAPRALRINLQSITTHPRLPSDCLRSVFVISEARYQRCSAGRGKLALEIV